MCNCLRCDKFCNKIFKCGSRCDFYCCCSLCGEVCICVVCEKNGVDVIIEIFLGGEDEEDVLFV